MILALFLHAILLLPLNDVPEASAAFTTLPTTTSTFHRRTNKERDNGGGDSPQTPVISSTTTTTPIAAATTTQRQSSPTTNSDLTPYDILQNTPENVVEDTSPPETLSGVKSLGIDYGLVRTGLALSSGYAPHPLTVLINTTNPYSDNDDDADANATASSSSSSSLSCDDDIVPSIIKTCENEKVDQIVLGLPLHKNGTLSTQAEVTIAFATGLTCACYAKFGPEFKLLLWDERYTSKEAAARLSHSKKATKFYGTQNVVLDAESACLILEHYYSVG
eukprot:CAMPEP_0172496372 /NCGR_PEP_ID=MMETSP1066-20121228/86166_1 /TAXON_ID=671091 /ORGANISM="Coscinodiscus wailesii, Strain CCMP2513" /LENGTH=276 /DNA_ID=CAMNT_0013268643 /DNA_START=83 /DNA_END=910 /DNA_ORIENTATION=+